MSKKEANPKITKASAPPTTSIGYSGRVTIKVQKSDKTLKKFRLHNEGLEELFHGICLYLAGISNNRNYIPRFLDLRSKEGNTILSTLSSISTPTINRIVSKGGGNEAIYYYNQYTAVIFGNQIVNQNPNGNYSGCYLYLTDGVNDLAKIPWPEGLILPSGLSAVIEWQLYIYNVGSSLPPTISDN